MSEDVKFSEEVMSKLREIIKDTTEHMSEQIDKLDLKEIEKVIAYYSVVTVLGRTAKAAMENAGIKI